MLNEINKNLINHTKELKLLKKIQINTKFLFFNLMKIFEDNFVLLNVLSVVLTELEENIFPCGHVRIIHYIWIEIVR